MLHDLDPSQTIEAQHYGRGPAPVPLGRNTIGRAVLDGRSPLPNWLDSFDAVVAMNGGDSFTDAYGSRRFYEMTAMIRLAQRRNIRTILGPQTIGPFRRAINSRYARTAANNAALTIARDSASMAAAQRAGIHNIAAGTDAVFSLPHPVQTSSNKERDVLLNLSGLLWMPNPHVDYHKYRTDVYSLLNALSTSGRTVSLLPHVLRSADPDNDYVAIDSILADHPGKYEVVAVETLMGARAAIADARILIGSRMHACLNALSVGTPALAWSYSRKFGPLMRDLSWRHSLPLGDPELIEKSLRVLQSDLRDEIAQVGLQVNKTTAATKEVLHDALFG